MICTNDNIERSWKLYIHTVPKEISVYDYDKYYIGITHNSLKKRWGKHGQGYKGQTFYRAIEKYGWDNIKHDVLYENLTQEEAENLEIYLIEKYKSYDSRYGYNASYGGLTGGMLPKQIAKYDLDGNYIKLYKNRDIAQKEVQGIISVGEGINSHGFQWLWIEHGEEPPKRIKKYVNTTCILIAKYDLDGNFLELYPSQIEIKNEYNGFHMENDKMQRYGFQWLRIDDKNNIPQKIDKYVCGSWKAVEKYDLHGNLLHVYANGKIAQNEYPNTNISIACGKQRITANGFQWKFKDDDKIIQDLSKNPNYNTIHLYDEDGYYIDSFENKRKALIYIGKKYEAGIKDKFFIYDYYNLCHGYRWSLNKVEKLPELIKMDSRSNPVIQIDENNNTIAIYVSAQEAANMVNGSQKSIIACCRGKMEQSSGYKWKYLKDIEESQICDSFLLEKFKKIKNILKIIKEEK